MSDASAKSLDSDAEMQATGANLIEVHFQAQGDRSLLQTDAHRRPFRD